MKQIGIILRKVFVSCLLLFLGGDFAWAAQIGASDYTSTIGTAFSNLFEVASNESLHLEFTNYHASGDTNNDHNWALYIYWQKPGSNSLDSTTPIVMRPNNWWYSGNNNPNNPLISYDDSERVQFTSNIDWSNFTGDMNGASVSIDVSQAAWFLIIRATAHNNGRSYTETMKIYRDPATKAGIKLSVDHAYVDLEKTEMKNVNSDFYNFEGVAPNNSLFSSTGDWESRTGDEWPSGSKGYRNNSVDTDENFTIKNLKNGDQVVITYKDGYGTFQTTNAKSNIGELLSVGSVVNSEEAFCVTQDGDVTLRFTSGSLITSVEITRDKRIDHYDGSTPIYVDVTPSVSFTSPQTSMYIGEVVQTAVSTVPSKATPTYSSSNTSVATVDAYGKVTAVGQGNATISATLGESEVSYTVNVVLEDYTTFVYEFRGVSNSSIPAEYNEGYYFLKFEESTFNYDGKQYRHYDKRFGINQNGWELHVDGGTSGLYNGTNNSGFKIRDLVSGDKIKIWFVNGTCSADASSNLKGISSTTTIGSETEYTANGNVVTLNTTAGIYIQRIEIKRNAQLEMSFSPTSKTHDLTSLDFVEPTLSVTLGESTFPGEFRVTYSSSNPSIAKPNVNPSNPGDIYFIRPGKVTITATSVATYNNRHYTASYDVIVQASEAIFTMEDEHTGSFAALNPYASNVINTGVVAENATTVTSIPFISMTFGNGTAATVVRNKGTDVGLSTYNVAMILDDNGSEHMGYTVEGGRLKPTKGTYYVFRPLIEGDLTITGLRKQENNDDAYSVVLVDAGDTSGGDTYPDCTSYKRKHTYSFSGYSVSTTGNTVRLEANHTYYLYGNNNVSSNRQVFYLHGFKYETDFKFAHKGVVIDGGSGTLDSRGFWHDQLTQEGGEYYYTQAISGVTNYTCVHKDKATNTETSVDITDDGKFKVDAPGSYVVTATVGDNKTSYVLTKPYTVDSNTPRISWEFNHGKMEGKAALNSNATNKDWATYYKVRQYDPDTKALSYINVPVRCNGINVIGDNARYFDNTAGLLFKANAREFGTTAAEPSGLTTLYDKLHCDPTTDLDDYKYVTLYNGGSMTIPALKKDQHVRIKWSRYSGNNGDRITAYNVTDLKGTTMNGVTFSVGAGGRVHDNGGTGYHEFIVENDGDVTFQINQNGWVNIYQVDVANDFIPTDLRLQTVDASASGGSRPSVLAYMRPASGGSTISNEYSTHYGRILSQSNSTVSYHIEGDVSPETNTRTGTLSGGNSSVSSSTLNVTAGAHGRFKLVQEGKVDGKYVLDRNEYWIKVYEYQHNTLSYPRTWDLKNMSSETGTALGGESSSSYKYWATTETTGKYKMQLEPENLISWNYKSSSDVPTAIRELDGLGIHPADITKENSIVLGTSNTGLEIGADEQVYTVPSVASGSTVYLRVLHNEDASVKDGSGNDLEAEYTNGSYKTYKVAGTGADVDFYLKNVTIEQVAVSADTKTVTAAGYATEARSYPLDFTLVNTLLGREQTSYKIISVSGDKVNKSIANYVPAGSGVMITGTTGSSTSWPLFTTDVNRTTNDMSGNLLVGVVTPSANLDQSTTEGGTTYYNYVLSTGGYREITKDNGDIIVDTSTPISGIGYYLVYKIGSKVGGTTYNGEYPNAHSAYLKLPSKLAVHQELDGSVSARMCFFLDFDDDDATGVQLPVVAGTASSADRQDDAYYTLQGVRVDQPSRGMYIRNGKKVYIK